MFTVDEIMDAAGGRFLGGSRGGTVSGVSIDSRTLREGDLFVALRGERFDGHDFLAAALDRGAAGVVIQETGAPPLRVPGPRQGGGPFWIGVDDTLRALQDLAAFHRRRFSLPVVGITGTNGKTTTKEMTAAVLRTKFPVCATMKNLNNHIGVPLTLFGLTAEHGAAVLEMGISGPGELRRLCEIAAPGVGVITNVGPAHLEGFGSIDAVAEAKAEILDGMGREGHAVLNADDPYFGMLEKRAAGMTSFGVKNRADVTAEGVRESFDAGIPKGLAFTLRSPAGEGEVFVPAVGVHNVPNALAAAAVGYRLGLTFDEIRRGLERFIPLPLRMTPVRRGDLDILNDAYNANPGSMAAALEVLAGLQKGRQGIAVLGDMLELGDFAPTAHRDLGRRVGDLGIHGLVAVGAHAAVVAEGAAERGMEAGRIRICRDPRRALEAIRELLAGKTVLLIKGSRGMEMEKIVQGLMEAP
ncbi:MAG: UDP-N-acetylmuramoyl-tripeptide--D-alanyl-D-alanine ligase [Nitrospirae bacterium]|nr:UDP-N-acetylmuramoyl-tripeptide--D-alanyl-D-alanine ligase [Nitrospirota bacterium]